MSLIPADPVTSGRQRRVGRTALFVPLLWAVAAMALGIALQVQHVAAIGSWEGTLRVGAESPARPLIAADLGEDPPVTDGLGHDGYWYYLSAADPLALDVDRHVAYLGYRHRRLLGPLLAGAGGLFPARATVIGLSVVGILGFGLAAGATAWLAARWGARPWAPVGAVLNVGLWLSVQLVTADTLAIGVGLLGVALVIDRRWRPAALVLVLAVLAKETSVLFALSGGWIAWRAAGAREAGTVLIPPLAALAVWLGYLELQIGGAFASNGNLGAPLTGMIESLSNLPTGGDAFYAWMTVFGVVVAVAGVAAARQAQLTALTVPWIAVAILATAVVWERGNNAARVLAPCMVLGLVGLGIALEQRAADA